MTHGDFMYEAQVRLEAGVVGVSVDPSTVSIMLNRAYQFAYQYCLDHFPWFYMTSYSFAAQTTILFSALPKPFRKLHCITVPAATFGMSRKAEYNEYNYVNGIPQLQSRTGNPIHKVDQDRITIAPSSTGKVFYYRKIGDVADTAVSTNITTLGAGDALLHPAFEEIVMLQTLISAYSRHNQISELNLQQQNDMLKLIGTQQDRLNEELKPLASWQKIAPTA